MQSRMRGLVASAELPETDLGLRTLKVRFELHWPFDFLRCHTSSLRLPRFSVAVTTPLDFRCELARYK